MLRPVVIAKDADEETATPALPAAANGHGATNLEPLVREWLLDLQVLGRSPKTIDWYRKHVHGYFQERSVRTLDQLTAAELKGYLAAIQARGLAENTVHGAFQTLKALANWAVREGYSVDAALLRVRAPKVAVKEMESYTPAQLKTIFDATPASWSILAIRRCRHDQPEEERIRLSEILRAIQQQLAFYAAWIESESPEVAASYRALIQATRRLAGSQMHAAWGAPAPSSDAEMNIAGIDYSELVSLETAYLASVRDHLAPWWARLWGQ